MRLGAAVALNYHFVKLLLAIVLQGSFVFDMYEFFSQFNPPLGLNYDSMKIKIVGHFFFYIICSLVIEEICCCLTLVMNGRVNTEPRRGTPLFYLAIHFLWPLLRQISVRLMNLLSYNFKILRPDRVQLILSCDTLFMAFVTSDLRETYEFAII